MFFAEASLIRKSNRNNKPFALHEAASQSPGHLHMTDDTLASYPVSHVTLANDPIETFGGAFIVPWDILGSDPQPLINRYDRCNEQMTLVMKRLLIKVHPSAIGTF